MKKVLIIVISLILSCCGYNVESDAPYRIPNNSLLILNKTITFPAQTVAIYLQNGAITQPNSIDNYNPFCILELKKRPNKSIQISPDKFQIIKANYHYEFGMAYPHYASTSIIIGDANPSHLEYETELLLFSSSQKNVSKLTCKHWIDPMHARFVTTKEIRQVLGRLFTLNLENDPRR